MSAARAYWLLVALTVWTLGVRLVGLDFGVPWYKEPDTFVADHVRMLREGEVKLDRALSACQYPSLLAHLAAPLSDATGRPTGAEHTLEEHLRSAARPWLDVRLVVAWLSILIVPGTFAIARRFVSSGWALFAAGSVSTSLLHVCVSQQARAHGPVIAFSACTVACALWLRREPSWRAYLATTVFAFLAVGMLHNGIAVLLPIGVAQLLRVDRKRFDPRLLLVAGAAALSFRVFYWYYFDAAASQAMAGDDATGSVLRDLPFDGTGFARLARTLVFYEPALLALLVLAGAAWIARWRARRDGGAALERGDSLVVLSYVVPYVALSGGFNQTYERFLLPLLPYCATFGAWGLSALEQRFARARGAVLALASVALAAPAFASTKLAWLRARPDTFEQAASWLREHVGDPAQQAVFVLPPVDLPLARSAESLKHPPGKAAFHSPWAWYQRTLDDDAKPAPVFRLYWLYPKAEFPPATLADDARMDAYLRSFGPGLWLVERIDATRSADRHRVVERLEAIGTRLARFAPDPDERFCEHPLWAQDIEVADWPNVFLRVLHARAVGPVVEIFEVR